VSAEFAASNAWSGTGFSAGAAAALPGVVAGLVTCVAARVVAGLVTCVVPAAAPPAGGCSARASAGESRTGDLLAERNPGGGLSQAATPT